MAEEMEMKMVEEMKKAKDKMKASLLSKLT